MLRLLLLPFVLPFPSFLLKKICHVDLVKPIFDLKWNFVWWNLGGFSIKHCLVCFWCIISLILKRISRIRFNFLTSIFFTAFDSQSCLSNWRQIYELTKVKQVRRGTNSCHLRSCLLSASSNTDTPLRTLLSAPLNPTSASSLRPPSAHDRRK